MAIPEELTLSYPDEEAFRDRFLTPLLQRLGYSIVLNYHGTREFGKDIIFGEVDRFGHVVYHAMQAKFVPSISLRDADDLIADVRQCFANPFRHPQKGANERITTLWIVTGGTVSNEATDHFFNSVMVPHGGHVRLLSGKDLLALDRLATFNRNEWIGERLTGLMLEIRTNAQMAQTLATKLGSFVQNGLVFPMERLRAVAALSYLQQPSLPDPSLYDLIQAYWVLVTAINEVAVSMGVPLSVGTYRQDRLTGLLELNRQLTVINAQLLVKLTAFLSDLRPLAGI